LVDGVNLGHPTYDVYRGDIAGLFPGYRNTDGAGGRFFLDTTSYENGVHTIEWRVTDDANNTGVVGFRYFTIVNPTPAPVSVDDDFNASTPGWGSDHFDSIQDGIDGVAVGGVVDVAAGTYTESLTLAKDACVVLSGDITLNGGISITDGTLVSTAADLSLTGDLSTTGGVFAPNDGAISFDGSGTQYINGDTVLFDVSVSSGVTVETSSNITVDGTLTNGGLTREIKPISGTGIYTYGLAGIRADVTVAGLTSLQVERRDEDHPSATLGIQTGKYWSLSPVGSGFTLDLTLPHNDVPTASDKVCRYTGIGTTWDCAADSFDSGTNTITRLSVTQLSDWATGDSVGPAAIETTSLRARSVWGAGGAGLMLAGILVAGTVGIVILAVEWRSSNRKAPPG
jgi:hypothetical protein